MKWYYAIGSQPFGPVDRVELESLYRAGTVTASTLILQEGMYDWVPLVDLKKTTQFLPCMGSQPKLPKDPAKPDPAPALVPEPAAKSEEA
jgi:hypothetical protein